MKEFKYIGAKSLIELHSQEMKDFCRVWKIAEHKGLILPKTKDPNYASLETLLLHVLSWSIRYMDWIGIQLGIKIEKIESPEEVKDITKIMDLYVEKLLGWWNEPLKNVEEEKFFSKTYLSPWNLPYTIDAMLEHAVMHPMRHKKQLLRFIEEKGKISAT